jgi:hypothetical protein
LDGVDLDVGTVRNYLSTAMAANTARERGRL